ncbi:MAG: alpha-ketoacid dehydrogenase subunit beta [Armatimonadota bacterium]|nr:alpha-ketoacid dehydrogenase subunit beta [Armatimonadota bacterium]MDR7449028.1 alpha-ketoacid dehydrogenase subunit beta [Armatimonadota bacterium]MDR7459464.1 alpha-ketoacid dehydrogenase subunit beta [Armatimonadota bacterium]MDR7480171.1 alpha-ketoacid dehydrogenase subunit beta [Armatimonadota bacterium]MDR7488553.1 alpha-ketoacid dehydrogenase subunit beta [Armatimonadota bacterium]
MSTATGGTEVGVRELSYAEAIREALRQAMHADERVILLGEDIGVYGGAFGVTDGLLEEFGPERVRDTPISEAAITGCAIGAAVTGLRPVVEIQFMDFITLAMEQLVLQAAKMRYMFGGTVTVPMVLRTPAGAGTGAAAQHSGSLEAWFAHVPGLKVVAPATPADAKALLLAAIADPNPVIVVEHKLLYRTRGPVPEAPAPAPLGVAAVRREGRDVTVVATSVMVPRALTAAERLAAEGVDVEVVDLRTLRPLDAETPAASARKTGRVVVVYEAVKTLGIGAEVAARLVEGETFYHLKAPVVRLGGAECPIPYNRTLERAAVPQEEDIVAAVRQVLAEG